MKKYFDVLSRDNATSSSYQESSNTQHLSEAQPEVIPNPTHKSIKVIRVGPWGVQTAQWNWVSSRYEPKKKIGLLELGHLAFGVRWMFFWEGDLRFLMYMVMIFTFRCTTYI